MAKKVIIMGAAGRDFHNFNRVYRNNRSFEMVAFTATQIPDIAGRKYPPSLAGKLYPKGIPILHEDDLEKLIARHVRSYDRKKDVELPDHPKALLAQRRKARDQKIFMRFVSLSDKADAYYQQLEQRRMNPLHHIRQMFLLQRHQCHHPHR